MEWNFQEREAHWLKWWEENDIYKVDIDQTKPKYYVLNMFPYPSGSGLHVGHPLGYIASDIYARYKRMKGFNVLNPMGFDAFGLPAEQYAIETGQHPAVTTEENITTFKRQLRSMGFSFDWNREFRTSDPEYYKWTQWIFLRLFTHYYDNDADKAKPVSELINKFTTGGSAAVSARCEKHESFSAEEWRNYSEKEQADILMNYRLAYQSKKEVNWCPELGTVLANDEVVAGLSERGGHPVIKKAMMQWSLRITAYADRLLLGLDDLDWSDSMKEMQRNWIGKSEGAQIFFSTESGDKIEVFTTRPDTIFGATFMVLAPEHDLVEKLTTEQQKEKIEKYLGYVNSRSDIERQQEKTVSGEFTGSYAINPFTEEQIPIYIAEYVLKDYGSGAIMAVPSDDDRDHAFAEKFGIEVIAVVDKSDYPKAGRKDKVGKMINSGFMNGMKVKEAIKAAIHKIDTEKLGHRKVNYKLRDAGFSRQRYWGEPFPITVKNGVATGMPDSELPVVLPDVDVYLPSPEGKAPLSRNTEWTHISESEYRETDTMPGYAGSSWYYLRYMDPHNENEFVSKEAESYWGNVDHYAGGAEHAVGHLLYARLWYKFMYDIGLVSKNEPFQKLFNQGMIGGITNWTYRIKDTNKFVSYGLRDAHDVVPIRAPLSLVEGNKLNTEEFKKWRPDLSNAEFVLEDGKYICGQEQEKMSKTKHNVVNPDDIIEKYGADVFRLFEMFLGPIDQAKPWDMGGIDGVKKFIRKFWRLFHSGDNEAFSVSEEVPTDDMLKIAHKALKKVGEDYERYSFNTAVSALMVATNELTALKCKHRAIMEILVTAISPMAPFIAEELWSKLGHSESVHFSEWKSYDEKYLKEDSIEYPVSINGKTRAKITLPTGIDKEEGEKAALENEVVQKWLEGKTPKKVIFVPGRIINIVV